jgi:hypothetical protein
MSHRTRFIPSGTPTPATTVSDTNVPLNDTQTKNTDNVTIEKDSHTKHSEIFSPAPKLNLTSLKKKAAATRNRQQQVPRTLIIPPTLLEVDENEKSTNDNTHTTSSTIDVGTVSTSPKVALRRFNSNQSMAPDVQPPAYTSSYVSPTGFIDHAASNFGILTHPQLSQTHIQYPPPSPAHLRNHQLHRQFQSEIPGSPHISSGNSVPVSAMLSTSLRAQSHSHTRVVMQPHPSSLETASFSRPPTPAPRVGERAGGEKRGSTADSDLEREREIKLYRGRSKRGRLQFSDAEIEVCLSPTTSKFQGLIH